jgi:heme-degrading monooxygenase HmoA
MIVRIWRTRVDSSRMSEYASFEQERSLPMFRKQSGCLGVLFLRTGAEECAALTMWSGLEAVQALSTSTSYRRTVRELEATGLLKGEQSVEVFEVKGGLIRSEAIGVRRKDANRRHDRALRFCP